MFEFVCSLNSVNGGDLWFDSFFACDSELVEDLATLKYGPSVRYTIIAAIQQ
jgi:hypothetical protein